MTTFLLLHGAFRGGWSWGRVAARLAVRGHQVLAPDLLGAGRRWRAVHPPVGLEATLDDLEGLVRHHDLHDVVLVGHSQGGFVAEALTQRIADRVRLVCHLDAPVPVHGQRAVDLSPGGAPAVLPPADAWVPPTPLDPDVLGVPRLVAGVWSARLTPLSVAIALDPVELDDPAALAIDRRYGWCSGTPAGFPSWHTRARRQDAAEPDTVLESPHDAPLAQPERVVRWLQEMP